MCSTLALISIEKSKFVICRKAWTARQLALSARSICSTSYGWYSCTSLGHGSEANEDNNYYSKSWQKILVRNQYSDILLNKIPPSSTCSASATSPPRDILIYLDKSKLCLTEHYLSIFINCKMQTNSINFFEFEAANVNLMKFLMNSLLFVLEISATKTITLLANSYIRICSTIY